MSDEERKRFDEELRAVYPELRRLARELLTAYPLVEPQPPEATKVFAGILSRAVPDLPDADLARLVVVVTEMRIARVAALALAQMTGTDDDQAMAYLFTLVDALERQRGDD
jgi:hypothetical protein